MKKKSKEDSRVVDSQCDQPLATASSAVAGSAHTPGPWGPAPHCGDLFISGSDAYGSVVCEVRQYLANERAESLANARLIAAAPEMLAALKVTLRHLQVGRSLSSSYGSDVPQVVLDAITQAQRAIAKAECP